MQPFFSQCQKNKHRTFLWEYFDKGISDNSKGDTSEAKWKNCAAVINCTGGSASGLLRQLQFKHSMEKRSSIQSDVSCITHSADFTNRIRIAYSQATLHSFMNKKTREVIVAKLVAVNGFPPSAVCKS